jgi:hypothetical protein
MIASIVSSQTKLSCCEPPHRLVTSVARLCRTCETHWNTLSVVEQTLEECGLQYLLGVGGIFPIVCKSCATLPLCSSQTPLYVHRAFRWEDNIDTFPSSSTWAPHTSEKVGKECSAFWLGWVLHKTPTTAA